MSISKRLAGKLEGLPEDIAELDSDRAALAETPETRRPRTGPGQITLAGSQIRELQARIDELEVELKEGARSAEVDLDDLLIVPGRQRHLSPQEYQEPKANLAQNPLATAITVRELPNCRFELISGHYRVRAYRDLGRVTIRADVVAADDDAVDRMAFYANLLSPSLAPYDKYLGLKRRADRLGLSQVALATESGLTRQAISLYFAFDELDPRILKVVEDAADRAFFGPAAAQIFSKVSADKLDLAVELARAVAEGALTAAAAQSKLNPPPAVDKVKPVHLRRGSQVVCSIQRKGKTVSLAFKDESPLDDEFVRALKDFLAGRMGLKECG